MKQVQKSPLLLLPALYALGKSAKMQMAGDKMIGFALRRPAVNSGVHTWSQTFDVSLIEELYFLRKLGISSRNQPAFTRQYIDSDAKLVI
jgi:hypothetical protein